MEASPPLGADRLPDRASSSDAAPAPEAASECIASPAGSAPAPSIRGLAPVDIDADGVFKYVLIRVVRPSTPPVFVVRGHAWAGYHDDVFQHHRVRILELLGAIPGTL